MNNIQVSQHAINRYIEKFQPTLSKKLDASMRQAIIANALRLAFAKSVYVKDDGDGILFRNYNLKADMIVKNSTIITIFPLRFDLKKKEEYAGN